MSQLQCIPLCALAVVVLVHLVPWMLDPFQQRALPGPWLAQFSDLWLAYHAYKGKRSEAVHAAHLRYGDKISRNVFKTPLVNGEYHRPHNPHCAQSYFYRFTRGTSDRVRSLNAHPQKRLL